MFNVVGKMQMFLGLSLKCVHNIAVLLK